MSEQRYLPFGEARTDVGTTITETDRTFTGQRDYTYIKLIDYGSRWYSPRLGRFTQPDSIVPDPGNPQSWNRFSYTYNNPINYIDPTGHVVENEEGDDVDCDIHPDLPSCSIDDDVPEPDNNTPPDNDDCNGAECSIKDTIEADGMDIDDDGINDMFIICNWGAFAAVDCFGFVNNTVFENLMSDWTKIARSHHTNQSNLKSALVGGVIGIPLLFVSPYLGITLGIGVSWGASTYIGQEPASVTTLENIQDTVRNQTGDYTFFTIELDGYQQGQLMVAPILDTGDQSTFDAPSQLWQFLYDEVGQ